MAKPSLDGPIPRPSAPAISVYPAGARRKRRPAGRVRDDHTVRGAILEPSGIVRVKSTDFEYHGRDESLRPSTLSYCGRLMSGPYSTSRTLKISARGIDTAIPTCSAGSTRSRKEPRLACTP